MVTPFQLFAYLMTVILALFLGGLVFLLWFFLFHAVKGVLLTPENDGTTQERS